MQINICSVYYYWTLALTRTFIDSMTSMKTSFFLYLIPSDLQDTALVTVVGTLAFVTSSLLPCCVMYLNIIKRFKVVKRQQ